MRIKKLLIIFAIMSSMVSASVIAGGVLRFVGGNESVNNGLPTMPTGQLVGDKQVGVRYGEWVASNGVSESEPYNCTGFYPDAADIELGRNFTQRANCLVDVKSERDVFYVYSSGKELFANREYGDATKSVSTTIVAVGERYQVSREYTGDHQMYTRYCVKYNVDPVYYKTVKQISRVYKITYSNGFTRNDVVPYDTESKTYYTEDRSVCVAGSPSLY